MSMDILRKYVFFTRKERCSLHDWLHYLDGEITTNVQYLHQL